MRKKAGCCVPIRASAGGVIVVMKNNSMQGFLAQPQPVHAALSGVRQKNRRGFLMTLEAAYSLLLILAGASLLAAFQLPGHNPQDFYLCSDAAILFSSQDFSDAASIALHAESLSSLSGMCISARHSLGEHSAGCGGEQGEVYSFSIPVQTPLGTQNAQVSCSRASSPG